MKVSILGEVVKGLGGIAGEILHQTLGIKPSKVKRRNQHTHFNVRNYFITKQFIKIEKPPRRKPGR